MAAQLTPMMRQYLELKEQYPDSLLFFRLGDFYEMFFEDAKTASRELELVLTGRDCGLEERAPMCGVPYHAVDSYINKLITKGYKVAICEQTEDPALAKGLVSRDVVRVITPGTVIEERMLGGDSNNYIAAVLYSDEAIGLAYADVSTGLFCVMQLMGRASSADLVDELSRIRPAELLVSPELMAQPFLSRTLSSNYYLEESTPAFFSLSAAKERLLRHFGVVSLASYGCEHLPQAISAAGALMRYLEDTQKNALSHIHAIKTMQRSSYMVLDAATRLNLELTQPLQASGSKQGTLLHLLNKTYTGMGARMLRDWIDRPLRSITDIDARLDGVEKLTGNMMALHDLQAQLKGIYDIERLCSRIVYGALNARDCLALRSTLARIPALKASLSDVPSELLQQALAMLDPMEDVCSLLCAAIVDEPPASIKEGGFIKRGYHAEVDELTMLSEGSREWLENFEAEERENSGIRNLKVGYNRVFGYYIEVTRSNLSQVPYHYQRKQTLANAERYITPELKAMEEKILGARDRLIALEYELFCELRETLVACTDRLQSNAQQIALIDCLQSLAGTALQNQYQRPTMNENGSIRIQNGRHPVIEKTMREAFVPNDVLLDADANRLLIITGPNMAGKSTYMRQVALITLMAHIGSFVPAERADIGICDRIFTRIGASDNLSAGQSTFMVEMSEVANILHNATPHSLLILDEIGRGTSTFDGLSIAWAVLEHIEDPASCGAKALFATHYHELTELEGRLPGVKNYRVTVKELGDDIVFLRKIVRGGTDKSFGIQVARLAGLPGSVLERAKEILQELSYADIAAPQQPMQNAAVQPSLLDATMEDTVLRILSELDIEHITPLEALNQLYSLRAMLKSGE